MSSTEAHTPVKIEQHDPKTLAIEWADGVTSLIDVRALRLACGCARCVDEWSGAPLLAPESVPTDVSPEAIESVGRYAIQVRWSDGHDTGIYAWETLYDLGAHQEEYWRDYLQRLKEAGHARRGNGSEAHG